MTKKSTIVGLVSLVIFIIAISRIGKTVLPGFKPSFLPVNPNVITEQIPSGEFVAADGIDIFLKSGDNLEVSLYAQGLTSPRSLLFDDTGALVVSSNKHDKIVRLRDSNRDGVADSNEAILTDLDRPHGIALHGGFLYVAEEERVTRYPYTSSSGMITGGEKIVDLPQGGRHFTRSIAIDERGKMFISVGSSCDTCLESNIRLASVVSSFLDGSGQEIFADGLRNAVFIKFHPKTGELYGTEMGRDHLGDNLPPDEVNIIKKGRGYGWPFCYGKQIYDDVFSGVNNCELSEPSLLDLPAHVSPLGFTFIPDSWGEKYSGDLLVAYHGSWNSSIPVGYRIERFEKIENGFSEGGKPFLEGFLAEDGRALGRPVDLVFDDDGVLYMSDDKGGFVYAIRQRSQ
jgi:glucose/arabinose dehydrogenase